MILNSFGPLQSLSMTVDCNLDVRQVIDDCRTRYSLSIRESVRVSVVNNALKGARFDARRRSVRSTPDPLGSLTTLNVDTV